MEKEIFIKNFYKIVDIKEVEFAKKIITDGFIEKSNYILLEGRLIHLEGRVLSSDLYSSYKVEIEVDILEGRISDVACTCDAFLNRKKEVYCCRHILALYLYQLENIRRNTTIKKILMAKKNIEETFISGDSKEGLLLKKLILQKNKKEVCLDVYINKNVWNKKIGFEFKIGKIENKKRYLIKDLKNFILNYINNVPIEFSKDFIFTTDIYEFTREGNIIFNMMKSIYELESNDYGFRKRQDALLNKKEILIPEGLLKTFLIGIKKARLFLNTGFFSREIETEVLECDIDLPIEVSEDDKFINIRFLRELPMILGSSTGLFVYDTTIYTPSQKQCNLLMNYISNLKESEIKFSIENKPIIFKELLPSLKEMTNELILDEKISRQLVFEKPKFKFYFDRDEYIRLKIKVVYGEYEFNIFKEITDKYIYRDEKEEQMIINTIVNLKFGKASNDDFVFIGSEDNAFEFFNEQIDKLHSLGEIYYSENFKGKLNITKNDFNIQVERGREDYFEFKYAINNIPENEFKDILISFRENKKYHKLNSGEYIDLEEVRLKELLKLLRTISNDSNVEAIEFELNKSIYVYEKLNGIISNYEGKEEVCVAKDKILKTKKFKVPTEINATLREYQVEGYQFFKKLSELGLGGLLGDEMGLGKTLQAITFITSEKNKKTLIIAPTSLIYNWENEFIKFSPNLNIIVNTGIKEKRKCNLKDLKDIDVIITSYSLLKNDLDFYKDIKFDFMILDEAQYIKNPGAQITKACKSINAKSKFALTGTPIENNLLELWSIFDFIMKGYLFDKKTFNLKYNRNLSEEKVLTEDLKKMITPFILRRLKRDVLAELPDKIEKIIYVDMAKEQKKIYSTYNKYVNELIDKKVSIDELKKENIEILSYITKLRQIALHPELVTEEFSGVSGKIEALKEIVLDTIEEGHKVLIFSQFTSALKIVERILNQKEVTSYYIDGSISSEKRMSLVNKFNRDDTNVFLISLKAGGTGLNLTSADIVIHLDPWWNPAVENQATDRAHRIGQKNVVEVIKLISKGSVEEKIISLQRKKKEIITSILDSNLEGSATKLSVEDLVALIKEN